MPIFYSIYTLLQYDYVPLEILSSFESELGIIPNDGTTDMKNEVADAFHDDGDDYHNDAQHMSNADEDGRPDISS